MERQRSKYELMLDELVSKAQRVTLSDEDNLQIFLDLNKGMEEFHFSQKVVEKETAMELTGIYLNA